MTRATPTNARPVYLEKSVNDYQYRQNADGDDCLKSSRKQRVFLFPFIIPSLE
jgi:hypothetical protein